jgi:hypothetical protein
MNPAFRASCRCERFRGESGESVIGGPGDDSPESMTFQAKRTAMQAMPPFHPFRGLAYRPSIGTKVTLNSDAFPTILAHEALTLILRAHPSLRQRQEATGGPA